MVRKWICSMCTFYILAQALGMAEATAGTIRVQPQWCGEAVPGGCVQISYVGSITDTGYVLTDGLADWIVEKQELESGNWVSWLAQKELKDTSIRPVAESGALFENLDSGVYLVQQAVPDCEWRHFSPFFLTIPEGECWNVSCVPKLIRQDESPKTSDRPAPLIGAMGIGLSVAFLMVFVDENRK